MSTKDAHANSEARRPMVLLVEDSPSQAQAICFALRNRHYDVSLVMDGKEALKLLNSGLHPALVVSDTMNAGMDGFQLCRAIKCAEHHADLPVILLTGLTDPGEIVRGLECGADSFVCKPVDVDLLLETIAHLLQPAPVKEELAPRDAQVVVLDTRDGTARSWFESILGYGFQALYWDVEYETWTASSRPSPALVVAAGDVIEKHFAEAHLILASGTRRERPALLLVSKSVEQLHAIRRALPDLMIYEGSADQDELLRQIRCIVEGNGSGPSGRSVPLSLRAQGTHRTLNVHLPQVVNLLLSTHANAVQQNRKLIDAQERLHALNKSLDQRVEDRTNMLAQSERGYRDFLRNTRSGFYRLSGDFRFMEVNVAFLDMLGYRSKDDVYALESAAAIYKCREEFEEMVRDGRTYSVLPTRKVILNRADGAEITVLEDVYVQTSKSGRLEFVEVLLHDITQLELIATRMDVLNTLARAANARLDLRSVLETLSTHLHTAFHAARIAVAIPNDLGDSFHIVAVEGDGAAGDGLQATFPASNTRFAECLARGETIYTSTLTKAGDGETTTLSDLGIRSEALIPISAVDDRIGVLAVGRDREGAFSAEDIKFLESVAGHLGVALHNAQVYGELKDAYHRLTETHDQIIQQERLVAIAETTRRFASDLGNAFNSVLGFTELLAHDKAIDRDAPNLREHLAQIREAAVDGGQIVDQLRQFYQPRETLNLWEALDVNDVVGKAIAEAKPKWLDQAYRRGVRLSLMFHLPPVPLIRAEFTSLKDAISHLVLNAVEAVIARFEFPPLGSTEKPEITIRTESDGDQVRVIVQDNGTGMPEPVRKCCFEPFYSTKQDHGAGLGLSSVYGITQRHSGTASVTSVPGAGTTFTLSFPSTVSAIRPPVSDESPEDTTGLEGLRVLVVDDNQKIARMVCRMLHMAGMAADSASSGAEALARFREQSFDVVITDKGMMGMSGDELALAIKRIDSEIPVIMLTGYGELMQVRGETPAHVDLVLSKPIQQARLYEAIRQLMFQTAAL